MRSFCIVSFWLLPVTSRIETYWLSSVTAAMFSANVANDASAAATMAFAGEETVFLRDADRDVSAVVGQVFRRKIILLLALCCSILFRSSIVRS